jgi:hypothetical protein
MRPKHPRQPAICAQCGADFMALVASVRAGGGRFCSARCTGDHHRATGRFAGERNPRWLGGVSTDNMRYRRRQRAKWPEKEVARKRVARAIASGKLTPQPCRGCGDLGVEAHHTDYSRPLDVVWLCRRCHDREHHPAVAS